MTADHLPHANDVLINVYPFWPIQIERGEGVYLYDTEGKKYLDFGAGIAVNALGYNHPRYTKAAQEQFSMLHMGLCYIADKHRVAAADAYTQAAGMDQVFFCSTGAEAVEGALKTARKWANETKGTGHTEVIHFDHSFHGRTMGALNVNGSADYRKGFQPMLGGSHVATFNDIESVKRVLTERVSAIIIEPVMGEGGIIPADPVFLKELRTLCDTHDICLIFDEVQCGMGRIGSLFAFQYLGVSPDILCLAKGLGAGFPVGAFLGKKKFTQHITPGSHGSTYGGNPMACRLSHVVLQEITADGFLDNVRNVGQILKDGLEDIARKSNRLSNVRGLGMMLAADVVEGEAKALVKECLKEGLIVLTCAKNSLRIVPPLVLNATEAQEGLEKLEKVLSA